MNETFQRILADFGESPLPLPPSLPLRPSLPFSPSLARPGTVLPEQLRLSPASPGHLQPELVSADPPVLLFHSFLSDAEAHTHSRTHTHTHTHTY